MGCNSDINSQINFLDYSEILNQPAKILAKGPSESKESRKYEDIIKSIRQKLMANSLLRKSPHKPNKLSGFGNFNLPESLKETPRRTIFKEPSTFECILIDGIGSFEQIIKKKLNGVLHVFKKEELKWSLNNNNEVLLPNGQLVYGIKKNTCFLNVLDFIRYLDKIRIYSESCRHPGYLKLIGLFIRMKKQITLSFSLRVGVWLLYEPYKETFDEYLINNKNKNHLKSFMQIADIFKGLQESGFFLKFIETRNFVRTMSGRLKLFDPGFELLYESKQILEERDLININKKYALAPEGVYAILKKQKAEMSIASTLWSFGIMILEVLSGEDFNTLETAVICHNYEDFKNIFRQEVFDLQVEKLWSLKNPQIPIKVIKSLLRIIPKDRSLSEPGLFKNMFIGENNHWSLIEPNHQNKFYLENGLIYEGDVSNNKPDGYGLLRSTKMIYEGQFNGGYMHGYGKLMQIKDRELDSSNEISSEIYMGGFEFLKIENLWDFKALGEFLTNNIDKEIAKLYNRELIEKYYEKSKALRAKTGEIIGLNGLEWFKVDTEKTYFLLRSRKNPLNAYEVILSEELKDGFMFYWNACSIGFFDIKALKMKGFEKKMMIDGVKNIIQGIKVSILRKRIEIGQFKGFSGKIIRGMIFDYDFNFNLKQRYKIENNQIIEGQNIIKDSKYDGLYDKKFKKTGLGKEVISNNIIYDGEFFNDKANGRGVYRDISKLESNIYFEGFVKDYKPCYGRFYGFQDKGCLEGRVFERIGKEVLVKGIYYGDDGRNYQGIFKENGLWIDEEKYHVISKEIKYEGFLKSCCWNGKGKYTDLIKEFDLDGVYNNGEVTGVLELNDGNKLEIYKGYKKIKGLFMFNFAEQAIPKVLNNHLYEVYSKKGGIFIGNLNENGYYDGFGCIKKPKSYYEGEFFKGRRHGFGVLIKALKGMMENEYKYDGYWKFGMKMGYGKVFKNKQNRRQLSNRKIKQRS